MDTQDAQATGEGAQDSAAQDSAAQDSASQDGAAALLGLVQALVLELHPRRGRRMKVTLDSTLDKTLGFDSLSRVELLLRVQRQFNVTLPEQMFADAETPRDLLKALAQAGATSTIEPASTTTADSLAALDSTPDDAETLIDVLNWHVERNPDRPHVYLYGDAAQPDVITHRSLADGARSIAAGLQAHGLQPGQGVSIMLATGTDYLHSFFGVLLAGGVPVPIYPPLRPAQIEDHLRRHARILANAQAVIMITETSARRVGRLLQAHVPGLREIVSPQDLRQGQSLRAPEHHADDVAFLQYTSGSTGQPKGVVLSHANLLANIRAMGDAVGATSQDVFVSWLPLYHDMGLIGAWLASLYFGMPLVLMSPLRFLTYPPRWLQAIHDHRATLTAAPNFAFELCLSKIEAHEVAGLDLSSLRMAFNGAEAISPNTVRRFTERFAPCGFKANAFAPVYGLAEATVGLAFPPLERLPIIDRIERQKFETSGRAEPAAADDTDVLEFVACGQPLPGYQIRITDGAGHEVPDRQEGNLQFQGPSATRGYQDNPTATAALFDGDWLDSGDLAYVAGGDVFLTRRVKDMIIRAGRNIYPYELEEAVGEIAGVRKGCVAVFGSPDPVSATERLVVVAETRETDPATLQQLQDAVNDAAIDVLDMPPDEVIMAPPHTVLKTSSGKIRRAAVRELFERDQLGKKPRAVWWQITRLALTAWQPRAKDLVKRMRSTAFAAYAYLLLALIAPPVWLLVAVLPAASARYSVAQYGARLILRLCRIKVSVDSLAPDTFAEPAVAVVNHASYLDGLLLVATLPEQFAFVAKRELSDQFIAGTFLRGIGAAFVERFDVEQSVADAQQLATIATSGRAILFFPEGTFTRAPGLRPFHMGAFVTAAQAGLQVIPITLVGTRSLLRADSWRPRHGSAQLWVHQRVQPAGQDWSSAVALRDAAREAILTKLPEPDLFVAEDVAPS